ncbi:interleukin-6 receptor subunit beta isoform X2 [Notolabrus celidotus]|uniref:interleukin-6 receptor subunit beta isoform X2 n=1 Tax=Notolabrus celidotus TaxID=1203425 RepID=UPI00148F8E5A|nr:interleukin-6 receptor subunit beta isoform X2 [Notolabrus celidotus]XP_034565829.1 interleukin-6 receptor subunit beta isoform X2 [Notolabrus celidotus]
MESAGQMLMLAALMLTAHAGSQNYLLTFPHPKFVRVGSNFTATCVIINRTEVTADDLYWNLSETILPREHYSKINNSAISVTFTVTSDKPEWLFCLCRNPSPNIVLNQGLYMHGIYLQKGYAVQQPPGNLSCVALQENTYISGTITCEWRDSGPQTEQDPIIYTLHVRDMTQGNYTTTTKTKAQVSLGTYPNHMNLEIWVEAKNSLGMVESEHLKEEANWFVKTNPPSDISVISEKSFPTSLLLNWTLPIDKSYFRLMYRIRFTTEGANTWTDVPQEDTSQDIQSFRLQNLQPGTKYISQVSCKNARRGHGRWSDWSNNATKWTPEAPPRGKPDLWMTILGSPNANGQNVQIACKDPVHSNGRITMFSLMIKAHRVTNASTQLENTTEMISRSGDITVLKQVPIPDHQSTQVFLTAINSVGQSEKAFLGVPERGKERPSVEDLRVSSQDGRLLVEWRLPRSSEVSEFVVEWVGRGQMDWQKENKSTTRTHITGPLEPFVCYRVSVYVLRSGWSSKATSVEAFLKEGAPSEAPSVSLLGVPGHDGAHLVWTQIPPERSRGFISTYTIYYRTGDATRAVTVLGNSSSYKLTSLSPDTTYDTWITASTIAGSYKGSTHSFTTQKYAPGEIEGIVVGVSLGFLFFFLMIVLLCFYKKDVIRENFWPRIPDPGESTIKNWSPDYSLKADLPRESCVSGISVLDVDVCDGRSLFDEEKAGLPLKKDKFLSEEHSSGIGGSSCMSSPRQSVSDSDEGGDMADTTASTVQYSSVVASSGYKGQTPAQPTLFSRSESTQPLLDCEENPDTSAQEGSRQSQRCSRPTGNNLSPQGAALREELQPLDFCSLPEDAENNTPAEHQSAASASSYMPQLGGYRPQ